MTERPPQDTDILDQERAGWEGMAPADYEPPEDEELTKQMEEELYNGSTPG